MTNSNNNRNSINDNNELNYQDKTGTPFAAEIYSKAMFEEKEIADILIYKFNRKIKLLSKRLDQVENDSRKEELNKTLDDLIEKKNYFKIKSDEIQKSIFENSYYDKLTSLPNKNSLELQIYHIESEYKSNNINIEENPVYIVYMDANNFKLVNDILGHVEGDIALKSIGDSLMNFATRNTFRLSNSKHREKQDFIYRLSGDEFGCIVCMKPKDKKPLQIQNYSWKINNSIHSYLKNFNTEFYEKMYDVLKNNPENISSFMNAIYSRSDDSPQCKTKIHELEKFMNNVLIDNTTYDLEQFKKIKEIYNLDVSLSIGVTYWNPISENFFEKQKTAEELARQSKINYRLNSELKPFYSDKIY
jgi:diguanylate cyclase (GGDEF)-like protein